MCFCAKMPSTTTGSIARTETAASLAHSVCSTETKLNIATVTGRTVLPLSTTANRNSFQAFRNTNTMVTAMPPRTCGNDDSPQRAQPAGAVEIGGFLHLEGNVLEIGHQQPDRERQREGQIDQDDALIGVDPADVTQAPGSRG